MTVRLPHIIKLGTAAVGGTVVAGLLALPVAAFAVDGDDAAKRPEDSADVVLVSDEDGDDDDTDTGGGTNSGTGDSNDGTNSRHTGVSRDNDRSQGDKTKDRTRDGKGDRTRDWSQNRTNDRSRNDTRG